MLEKWLKKLRTIVKYNQTVQGVAMDGMRRNINSQLSTISNDLNTHAFDTKNIKQRLTTKHLEILKILEDMDYDLNIFKKDLSSEVKDMEIPYYAKSKKNYNTHQRMPRQQKRSQLRESQILANDVSKKMLIDTVQKYVSAEYACCQLTPGYGDITSYMLHGTPLYIVDEDKTTLEEFASTFFNEITQRRTNFYTMDDNDEDPLHKLPQGQIGCVVAIDVFNFKTVKVIKKYLASIYTVLRTGGTVIFTFNNCDYPKAIDKVDEMYYCYTTSEDIISICKEVGFEILKLVNRDYDEKENGISWFEIKKPGECTTIRAAQGLAEIKIL